MINRRLFLPTIGGLLAGASNLFGLNWLTSTNPRQALAEIDNMSRANILIRLCRDRLATSSDELALHDTYEVGCLESFLLKSDPEKRWLHVRHFETEDSSQVSMYLSAIPPNEFMSPHEKLLVGGHIAFCRGSHDSLSVRHDLPQEVLALFSAYREAVNAAPAA